MDLLEYLKTLEGNAIDVETKSVDDLFDIVEGAGIKSCIVPLVMLKLSDCPDCILKVQCVTMCKNADEPRMTKRLMACGERYYERVKEGVINKGKYEVPGLLEKFAENYCAFVWKGLLYDDKEPAQISYELMDAGGVEVVDKEAVKRLFGLITTELMSVYKTLIPPGIMKLVVEAVVEASESGSNEGAKVRHGFDLSYV